jgi:hypothetical protein
MHVDLSKGISTCSYSQCEGREFDPPPLHQDIVLISFVNQPNQWLTRLVWPV